MVSTRFAQALFTVAIATLSTAASAQSPAPFPRPAQPSQAKPPVTAPPRAADPAPPVSAAPPANATQTGDPTEATLGVPLYPGMQFVASYDAGHAQRYYLFGSQSDFSQIVGWYKTMLKEKGELIFEEPPVHMFDIGKFKEETMGFPPSVTVKDYTWAGSLGYLNPTRGATPERFKTIVQIVPNPPGAPK